MSKYYISGYKYSMSAHMVICRGPVDSLSQIVYGERLAWAGAAAAHSGIYIGQPNLFGGDDGEGGLVGWVEYMPGTQTQARSGNIQAVQSAACPAYRGLCSLFFVQTTWASRNPYFKSVWARVTGIHADWDDEAVWYPSKATIKRLKGVNSSYSVTVVWSGENHAAPQSVTYKIQYRIAGSSDLWVDAATGLSQSGGAFPTSTTGQLGGVLSGYPAFSGGNNQTYTTYSAGVVPSGSRTHNITLAQDAYEFQVVKTNGSRAREGDTTLTGTDYGGAVYVSAVAESVPTWLDMNPAHIIYKLLTQRVWKLAIPADKLDDDVWRATADTLYDEGFGLSFELDSDVEARQHIQTVLDHINGYLKENMATGKLELRLIRDDYDVDELLELKETTNILAVTKFQRAMYGDVANEVTVEYRDDDENVKTVAWHNEAAILAQGGVVPSRRVYAGVHRDNLAARIAQRDCRVTSALLAKLTITTNRALWNHDRGDVVAVTLPDLGFSKAPFRIASIDKGDFVRGEIRVELVEDIFGLGATAYDLDEEVSDGFDSTTMEPPANVELVELPYWYVATSIGSAELAELPEGVGFAQAIVERETDGAYSFSYQMDYSPDDDIYAPLTTGNYAPTSMLDAGIGKTDTTLTLAGGGITAADMNTETENFLLVGGEWMAVLTFDDETYTATVKRGVLDTVPADHAGGARVSLVPSGNGMDITERLATETAWYRIIPVGSGTGLDAADAPTASITFDWRFDRPYPPGKFRINAEYFPASVDRGDIVFTWAHRDRVQQTAGAVDFTEDSIGPEAGTEYVLDIYDGDDNLLRSQTLTGTTWTWEDLDIVADGDPLTVKVELKSVRDSLDSWQHHAHEFTKPLIKPEPVSVAGDDVAEGSDIVFTVTMSHSYTEAFDHAFSITATKPADIGAVSFSDGVTDNLDGTLNIPGGVDVFTVTIETVDDVDLDPGETVTFDIRGVSDTVTIIDND